MFERTLQIIDELIVEKIKIQKILLVGIGGVGGVAFESLIRLGFQNITIIDNDSFEESNLNRQLLCTTKTIGKYKVIEAKKRGLEINPKVQIKTHISFIKEENIDTFFTEKYDYIIDACDTITTKYLLIKKAIEQNIKIISCLGTGNRRNPSELVITKLKDTTNDPLAKALRSLVKKHNISLNIPVVWSKELPIKTQKRTIGSLMLVPASAGLLLTYYVLEDIQKKMSITFLQVINPLK